MLENSNIEPFEILKMIEALRKEFKDDLKDELRDLRGEIKNTREEVNHKFEEIESKINEISTSFHEFKREVTEMAGEAKAFALTAMTKPEHTKYEDQLNSLSNEVKTIKHTFSIIKYVAGGLLAIASSILGIMKLEHLSIFK
ncbi:MAG: hypothetical protein N3A54_01425 [Patescibacteria group bacterium]|nr:hypothetical protein [Patescibacteria group bacterium]